MIFLQCTRKFKFVFHTVKYYSTVSSSNLVSCSHLAKLVQNPTWHKKIRILDATWDLDDKDYQSNHFQNRIPRSRFFSFDECRDRTSKFPRMLPTAEEFSAYVTNLGIGNNHHVIVYDNHETHSIYSSPRVWWMFKVFGHENISVLEGGLASWILEGHPVASGNYTEIESVPSPSSAFVANMRAELVKGFEFMQANAQTENAVQVMDARPKQRFLGVTDEGDIDSENGHMPHSTSVPFGKILSKETRSVRTKEEIKEYLRDSSIDINRDLIASCGSGVTACILSFAAFHAANKLVPVYDGSWSEWKVRAPQLISRGKQK